MLPDRRDPRRHARAFTLTEMAVTVAVLGIATAVSYNGIDGLRSRTATRNGIREVVTALKSARAQAFARGSPVVFFLQPTGSDRYEYGLVVDVDADFDPTDLSSSLESTDPVLLRREVAAGVYLRRTGSDVFSSPLPAPVANVPATAPCTFCTGSGPVIVVFRSDGTAQLGPSPGEVPVGGSFALVAFDPRKTRPSSDDTAFEKQTVAVLSRAGTVFAFER